MLLTSALALIGFAGPMRVMRAPTSSVGHGACPAPLVMYAGMAKASDEDTAGSFVQVEMRGAAMALHTKQQAPREGKAEAKKPEQAPVQSWQPGKAEYLQFLVDSRHVYRTLEEIVGEEETFAPFRDSGLERADALNTDIAWFAEEGVEEPSVAPQGETYAKMLREMAERGELEAFVCHFYNFYFAHTAGGRMIGKRMADMLLDGRTLDFYQWSKGDVDKELLPALRGEIDALANTWTREQKDACLAQTADSFKYGGALLQHISKPNAAAEARSA